MKTAFLALLLVFSCSVFAGTLTDSANVFGPQGRTVNNALASLPVWFETFVATPSEGIKLYADARIAALTQRGFIVVVTTQPRAWRISMAPEGIASSEAVRMAGDRMAAQFKAGRFADGALGAARELTQLADAPAAPLPPPIERTARVTPTPVPVRAVSAPVAVVPVAGQWWSINGWWVILTGALVGVGGIIVLAIAWTRRADREAREAQERREESAREARAEEARLRAEIAELRSLTSKSGRIAQHKTKGATQSAESVASDPQAAAEARRVYESYTPRERERLVVHHQYDSGYASDPFMFYMMMSALQPHYVPVPTPAPVYYNPPPQYNPPPPPAPSYTPPPSLSDDRRRDSPSYDPGPSAPDTGSISDASGGSGQW